MILLVLDYSFEVRSKKPEAKVSFCLIGRDQSVSTAFVAVSMINYTPSSWYRTPVEGLVAKDGDGVFDSIASLDNDILQD